MIVWHGSGEKGLHKLEYSEDFSRFGGADGLKYGAAIYMTLSEEEAKAYATGGSYYKVEVSGEVFDATDEEVLNNFVKDLGTKLGYDGDLTEDGDIQSLIKYTLEGKSSGLDFADNVSLVIGNNEYLYNAIVVDLLEEDIDALDDIAEKAFHWNKVILNNNETQKWLLCTSEEGEGLTILEEFSIEE